MEQKRAILIVSPRWQTRAMLAAQLGEMTEHDVVSAPGVNQALGLIKVAGVDPVLLVVDAGQEIAREDVDRLLEVWLSGPVILVVSALLRPAFAPLRDRCAAFLTRPVSIGQIAEAAVHQLDG